MRLASVCNSEKQAHNTQVLVPQQPLLMLLLTQLTCYVLHCLSRQLQDFLGVPHSDAL
jgi:hypothetical protein